MQEAKHISARQHLSSHPKSDTFSWRGVSVRWSLTLLGLAGAWLIPFSEAVFVRAYISLVLVGISAFREYRSSQEYRAETERVELAIKMAHDKANALENKLLPRRVTPEQREQIIELLKDTPKGELILHTLRMDDEAKQYALDVKHVLVDSGFIVKDQKGVVIELTSGLWISVRSIADAPQYADDIIGAFKKAGLEMYGGIDMDMPKGIVHIGVGQKRITR